MDPQTTLLIALALLAIAGICVGVAGVVLFRRMGAAIPTEPAAGARDEGGTTSDPSTPDEPPSTTPEPEIGEGP